MAKKIKPEPKPKKPEDGTFTRERAAPAGAVKGKAVKGAAKEKPVSEANGYVDMLIPMVAHYTSA